MADIDWWGHWNDMSIISLAVCVIERAEVQNRDKKMKKW